MCPPAYTDQKPGRTAIDRGLTGHLISTSWCFSCERAASVQPSVCVSRLEALVRTPALRRQLHLEPLADGTRCTLQRDECDGRVRGIEQALHRGPTRLHAARELRVRDIGALHLLRQLVGDSTRLVATASASPSTPSSRRKRRSRFRYASCPPCSLPSQVRQPLLCGLEIGRRRILGLLHETVQ